MGVVRSWVEAEMLHPEYCNSAADAWFPSDVCQTYCESGVLDFYNAYDAGGPLDNAAVQ